MHNKKKKEKCLKLDFVVSDVYDHKGKSKDWSDILSHKHPTTTTIEKPVKFPITKYA